MDPLTPKTIKAIRTRLGLTQPQFADRIGCTAQAVSYWERGTRTPRGLYAVAIRRLMNEMTPRGWSRRDRGTR